MIALECAIFIFLLAKIPTSEPRLKLLSIFMYISLGVAAFVGGTYHGFFLDTPFGVKYVFTLTLIIIGLVPLSSWLLCAEIMPIKGLKKFLYYFAPINFIVYIIIVLLSSRVFIIAIINYLPALIALLIVFAWLAVIMKKGHLYIGVLGLVLSLVASALHSARISFDALNLSANSLYHIIQGIALLCFYIGIKWLIKQDLTHFFNTRKVQTLNRT